MITISVNQNIALRQIQLTDASVVFETIDNQREYLEKWLPFVEYTTSVYDTLSFITSVYLDLPEKQELLFVILYDDTFCGLIGYKNTNKITGDTEIGYWLAKAYQHKGIITRSVQALTDYAFNTLGLERIRIKCATGNTRSQMVALRLNFVHEKTEPKGELLTGNVWTDINVYIKHRITRP